MANKTARLGDLATYINGYAFKPADWGDTGLPIIRIQDLTGNSYQLNRYDGEYPAPSFAGGRTGCCRTLQGRPV